MSDQIDWSVHEKYPENTCTCKCGVIFRSHTKTIMSPTIMIISRKTCPSCGKQDLQRISSDPETYSIKG